MTLDQLIAELQDARHHLKAKDRDIEVRLITPVYDRWSQSTSDEERQIRAIEASGLTIRIEAR
jgi:hypothetical protein